MLVRRELQIALDLARTLPPDDLTRLLGDLREIETTALARLYSPPATPIEDRLLNIEECAARLSCSRDWLYRNSAKLPFARPHAVGGKLLFSSTGLDLYLKKSR
jgi:predicted DNA-binding transcriptional regulator AlpA